jgi:hypothetical protein
MAHHQEVVGSKPGTVYWMDASYYIQENNENKVYQKGQTPPKNYCTLWLSYFLSFVSVDIILLHDILVLWLLVMSLSISLLICVSRQA